MSGSPPGKCTSYGESGPQPEIPNTFNALRDKGSRKQHAKCGRATQMGEDHLACEQAGITVTLPKPMTSQAKFARRFGKQDFVYLPEANAYRCPAGERLRYYYSNVEHGLTLRRY
jgi:hypothetical protein